MQLGFAKCQRVEVSLIISAPNNLYHDNLCQIEIFWKRKRKNSGWEKSAPKAKNMIHINRFGHASTRFNFIDNLNIDCSVWNVDTKSTLGTHRSKLPIYFGWKYVYIITYKCLAKLVCTSSYSQYCGYITPMLSITPWVEISFWDLSQGNQQPLSYIKPKYSFSKIQCMWLWTLKM